MSELNTYYIPTRSGNSCPCYLKSEADKVIAELEEKHKTEVKELLCLIRDKENNFNRAFDSEEEELRHHKYKRCLAIANGCKDKINYWHIRYTTAAGYDRSYEKWKYRLLIKWRNRWLELAEKFKEAK